MHACAVEWNNEKAPEKIRALCFFEFYGFANASTGLTDGMMPSRKLNIVL